MRSTLRSLAASLGISVVSALLVTTTAHAQHHVTFLIGPMAGYNFVMYRTDAFPVIDESPFQVPHQPQSNFLVQNGTGRGYFVGISDEDPLSKTMHHFLIFEAGFDAKPATFSMASSGSGPITYTDTTIMITGVKLWTTLSYIYVNLGYRYNFCSDSIPNGLGIQLCLSIGVKWEADFLKSVSDEDQAITNASAISTANALRLALRPELTYDLPFTDSWVLTPFAGYELPLTKVDPTENWWASALYGGLTLRYAIW